MGMFTKEEEARLAVMMEEALAQRCCRGGKLKQEKVVRPDNGLLVLGIRCGGCGRVLAFEGEIKQS